jgi:hypothetical protein
MKINMEIGIKSKKFGFKSMERIIQKRDLKFLLKRKKQRRLKVKWKRKKKRKNQTQ